jgi:L-rhamnono-1,4-lactonase
MCKPNLRIETGLELVHHPEYISWCEQIERLARFPTAYMKLSGLFSELPPLPLFTSEAEETALIVSLAHKIRPWTDAIFQRFGPSRIMFGSDWPVCNIGGGGNTLAWVRWKRVVEMVLEERAVTESERRDVWGRVAGKVYRCFPDS